MILKGLQKTTLVDFPGHVACTVFTYGCNFRCPFCHNPELVLPGNTDPDFEEDDFFTFLESRDGLLEGVCITGGEPTLHNDLPDFIKKMKDKGFKVKLDTNGTNPKMLESLIKDSLLDYIAMDIKNDEENYSLTIGLENFDLENIKTSIALIKNSGVAYEFRTTVVPGLHDASRMEGVGKLISPAKKFAIQNFRKGKTLDPSYGEKDSFTTEKINEFKDKMGVYVEEIEIR